MKESFLLKTISFYLIFATLLQNIPYTTFFDDKADFLTAIVEKDLDQNKDSEKDQKNQSELDDKKDKTHPNRLGFTLLNTPKQERLHKESISFDSMVIEILLPPPEAQG